MYLLNVKGKRAYNFLLAIITLILPAISSASITKTDSLTFFHPQLNYLGDTNLYLIDSAGTASDCSYQIQNAEVNLKFDVGKTYAFADQTFSANISGTVTAYSTFSGTSGAVAVYNFALQLNQDKPEQLFNVDFTSYHWNVKRLVVDITGYSSSALVQDSIRLAAFYTEEFGVDVSAVSLTGLSSNGSNPTTFKWSPAASCDSVPNYEFQVLKLYNTSSAYEDDETKAKGYVDWNNALSIITDNADTSITLTLAEGTGNYLWRVRPIGTYYSGGYADSRNWGSWYGETTSNDTLTITSTPTEAYRFFYTQFDDTLNWNYSRIFTEGDMLSRGQTKLTEQISYADGLGALRQQQRHLPSTSNVLISQHVPDFSGRMALSSLPAPVATDTLQYHSQFLKYGNDLYTAQHFDADSNYNDPEKVTDGATIDYYSDSNSDVNVPSAENYPFGRTLYYGDGTSRIREQGGPGNTLRIRPDSIHTIRTFYGSVSDDELVRVFGDEAPAKEAARKVINIDQNGTISVSYTGKEGVVLATCLSGKGDTTLLEKLNSYDTFGVSDTLGKGSNLSEYVVSLNKPIAFAEPTQVTVGYGILAKTVKELCTDYCSTCDYNIEVVVRGEDTTITLYDLLLKAQSCGSAVDTSLNDTTITLGPGTFTFEKRITANNINPITTTDSTAGSTYLDNHMDSIRARIEADANDTLATIYDYLSRSSIDSLYDYLDDVLSVTFTGDTTVEWIVGCDTFDIPISFCDTNRCDSLLFEDYFEDYWANTHYIGTTGGFLNYLPSGYFQPGEFDQLVDSMADAGYDCDTLWNCWKSLVHSYDILDTLSDTSTYDLDLLTEFLNCTGRMYAGVSTNRSEYALKAHRYFKYTWGDNSECENEFCTATPCSTMTADTRHEDFEDKDWEQFYSCVYNYDDTSDRSEEMYYADMSGTCLRACESRYEGFKTGLIRAYHKDSMYVEGDAYELEADTILGLGYTFSATPLDPLTYDVSMEEIECAARALVEDCQLACRPTIYYDGSGNIDSVGNATQQEAMKKAMTWAFDISIIKNGTGCSTGFDTIFGTSKWDNDTNIYKLWDDVYGGTDFDGLWVLEPLANGNMLLGGFTISSDTVNDISDTLRGSYDYWITEVNGDGYKVWERRFGGSSIDALYSAIQTSDGGFLLGGTSASPDDGEKSDTALTALKYDFWVIRLDPFGEIVWDTIYGDQGYHNTLVSVSQLTDSTYLLAGYKDQKPSRNWRFYQIDDNGAIHEGFNEEYTSNGGDDALFVGRPLKDGSNGFILAGYSDGASGGNKSYSSSGKADYWVYKYVDRATRDTVYGTSNYDELLYDLELTEDSGFIMAGLVIDSAGNYYGVEVIKINSDLQVEWDSAYYGDGEEADWVQVMPLDDGGYLVGASSKSNSSGHKSDNSFNNTFDYWIFKIDHEGNFLWDQTFGGTDTEVFTSMATDKGGYWWFGGYSLSPNSGNKDSTYIGDYDYWVVKAREYCTTDSICFKWIDSEIPADSADFTFTRITCDSITAEGIYNALQVQTENLIEEKQEDFLSTYRATCAVPDSIADALRIQYDLDYHHYTLYYHDRAGNLTKTVAPRDVIDTMKTRNQHPAHLATTKYKFNSLQQLVEQETPDGGKTEMWYDSKGQLRFSRNAQQAVDQKYTYTLYDNLGRIIETGESDKNYSTFTDSVDITTFPDTGTQRVFTIYTTSGGVTYTGNQPQRYLQNRVSMVYNDDQIYTYFSYDPHGNVEWMIQDLPDLGKKYLKYEYDLLSGNVIKVIYNEGQADQFHHRYTYDGDNRLTKVETSRDGKIWDRDARYEYYAHGPLKRTEIGEDNIQGIDYVYTINGWLKGINHPSLDPGDDPGSDHEDNDTTFAKDVFGMTLFYHDNDFVRQGSAHNNWVTVNKPDDDLYNGNIKSWTLNTSGLGASAYNYEYDQLNRLVEANFMDFGESGFFVTDDYKTAYSYDANGNITTLDRRANGASNTIRTMDQLTYHYITGTNQLDHVDDTVTTAKWGTDIDDQDTLNYLYDELGNLVKDVSASIDTILWTLQGKVDMVVKTDGDTIEFDYDAFGNRIRKRVVNSGTESTTYYVRDGNGQVMSIYRRETNANKYTYGQAEIPIYGSSRVGVYKPDLTTKWDFVEPPSGWCDYRNNWNLRVVNTDVANHRYTRDLMKRYFELGDHLGNVRAVISDRKNQNDSANVESFNSYYAFGSPMPGRSMLGNDYRFGFNGQEVISEVYGNGNYVDFEYRGYNPRIARFFAVDPLAAAYPHWTPYQFAGLTPIWARELEGLEPSYTTDDRYQTSQGDKLYNYNPQYKSPEQINYEQTVQQLPNYSNQLFPNNPEDDIEVSATIGVSIKDKDKEAKFKAKAESPTSTVNQKNGLGTRTGQSENSTSVSAFGGGTKITEKTVIETFLAPTFKQNPLTFELEFTGYEKITVPVKYYEKIITTQIGPGALQSKEVYALSPVKGIGVRLSQQYRTAATFTPGVSKKVGKNITVGIEVKATIWSDWKTTYELR